MKDLEEQGVCVKFCIKLGKSATETWKIFNKPSETNVWAERSVLSGTVVSKQEERRLMKISEVDDLPRQQTTFTSMQFVIWFSKIAVWLSERLLKT